MEIREVRGGRNLSFVLEETSILQTEYKIMLHQETAALLPCMQYRRNGREALCYITRGQRPFSEVIRNASEEVFFAAAADLFLNIARLQENGFLSCRRLDIDLRRIYADRKTCRTSLLYYPVDTELYQSDLAFDRTLRNTFIGVLREDGTGLSAAGEAFLRDLQDPSLSVMEIGGRLLRLTEAERAVRDGAHGRSGPEAILTAAGTPRPLVFRVRRDVYTIGRRGQSADGVIPDDRRVGRVHCRIYRSDGRFYIRDLGSVNGTFINGERLIPDRRYALTDGCSVCIAGTAFTVTLKETGQDT